MLGVIRAKACKKCGGDLSLECDIYGVYIQCIQCGANFTKEDLLSMTDKNRNVIRVKTPAAARKQTLTRAMR